MTGHFEGITRGFNLVLLFFGAILSGADCWKIMWWVGRVDGENSGAGRGDRSGLVHLFGSGGGTIFMLVLVSCRGRSSGILTGALGVAQASISFGGWIKAQECSSSRGVL
jgi:hypothetical protein